MSEHFDTPEAMLIAMQEHPCGHYWHKARPMVERVQAAEREATELRERNAEFKAKLRGLDEAYMELGERFDRRGERNETLTSLLGFEVGAQVRGEGFYPCVYLVTKRGVRHEVWVGRQGTHTEDEAKEVALYTLRNRLKQLMA